MPCGKAKTWDKHPQLGSTAARDAYTGRPFKVNREYAERFGDRWVILSAKYGFLDPSDLVEGPYDITFKRRSPELVNDAKVAQQVREQGLDGFDDVIGLGGHDYRDVVRRAFTATGVTLHFPFAGMSLGFMLSATKQAITAGQALPD